VAAIGEVTAAALREAGLPPDVVAESAESDALVAGLVRHAAARGAGRSGVVSGGAR
jgi:uroporphyrinogen-III synthase